MRDVIVVGGGCYGTFYAAQLAKAKGRGRAEYRRVVIVDRDTRCQARVALGQAADREFVAREWTDYFRDFLGGGAPAPAGEPRDYIVPSPLMPHLMFEWVLARARARWPGRAIEVAPVPGAPGTPYDRTAPAPHHTRFVSFADWICPTHCIEPAVVCRHHVFGVGTFAVDAVLAGDALVQRVGESGAAAAVLVGTISSCHGAVNLLRIGPARAAEAAPALETI